MKINPSPKRLRRGILMLDLAIALGLLAVAITPVAISFAHETRLMQAEIHRAVAMEIVDGEAEVLAAGDWKHFPEGTQDYPVRLKAAAKLPEGKFQLTRTGNHLRLEWKPERLTGTGVVYREVTVK